MYQTIYKTVIRNENDEMIIRHLYTDYDKAVEDAQTMACNRKESKGVDSFTQRISHATMAATVIHHFDDDLTITVRESGWAEDVDGQIRLSEGTDYTGNTNYKFFQTEKEFAEYIKSTQPVFVA